MTALEERIPVRHRQGRVGADEAGVARHRSDEEVRGMQVVEATEGELPLEEQV